MKSIGLLKRGDTLQFAATLVDKKTGEKFIGAADHLRCQGRDSTSDALIVELIIEEFSPGTYTFTSTDDTASWIPNSTILFDVEYSDNGVVTSSATFSLDIEEDITHD